MNECNITTTTQDAIDRIVDSVMPRNATPLDRLALGAMIRSYNLDPLRKEVYPLSFGGKLTLYVSIDGWRRLARDSGRYKSGNATYESDETGTIDRCTFTVVTTDGGEFSYTCWLKEFKGNTPNWRNQPLHMLRKCAEAHCLKAAFGFSGASDVDIGTLDEASAPAHDALAELNQRVARRTTVAPPPARVVEQLPAPEPANSDATVADSIAALAREIEGRASTVGIKWSAKQAVAAARKTIDLGTDPNLVDGLILQELQRQAERLEKGTTND